MAIERTDMIRKRRRPLQRRDRVCSFCKEKTKPDYKEADKLVSYLTERGKIIGRGRSGTCAKHQRKLAQAVKRARHLGLLPFVERV